MKRRTYLCAIACSITGCVSSGSSETSGHEVYVRNWTDDTRTLGVIVEGEIETLFNHRYELDAEKVREGYGYHGDATQITAILDGDKQFQFPYDPTVSCSGSNKVGIMLTITSPDEVEIGYGCRSMYDPYTTNGQAD